MDNLTPKLNVEQLKQNIDALLKGGTPKEKVQQYVDNYGMSKDGLYTLKTVLEQENDPAASVHVGGSYTGENSFGSKVGKLYKSAAENIVADVKRPSELAQSGASPLEVAKSVGEAGLRTVGNVASAAVAPIAVLAEPFVRPLFEKLFQSKGGALTKDKSLGEQVSSFSQKHPELSKDIEAIVNIAGLFAGGSAEKGAKEGVQAGLKNVDNAIKNASIEAGSKASEKSLQTALEAVTPKASKLSPTEYADAVKYGKVSPKTMTSEAQYVLSDTERAAAQKYAPILQSKDPIVNATKVRAEITKKNDLVGKYLESQSPTQTAFNNGQLKNYLLEKLSQVSDITVDDAKLLKAKTDLVDAFIKTLPKNDTPSLWKARKAFDSFVESKLNAFSGAPGLKKDIARSLRNGVQDFISELTDNVTYKSYMKDMTELFDIQDTLVQKAINERSRSEIINWVKNNPIKAKAAGLILTATGLKAFTPL